MRACRTVWASEQYFFMGRSSLHLVIVIHILAMGPVDVKELIKLIEFNDADELLISLNTFPIDPNATDDQGWSMLHWACKLGQRECV